jgi:hypothetical protein
VVDEDWLAADGPERADWTIHAAGDHLAGAGKQLLGAGKIH